MAHTPGPWMVGGLENTCVTPSTDTHARICVCWDTAPKQLDDGSWEDHTQEIQANARLIAAAPALLAALRAAKNELIELYERAYPDDESDNDTTKAIDAAIAAIAKAEGRVE